MRSQLRFIMHPDDEISFVSEVLSDESIFLIDGPRWKKSIPSTFRSIKDVQGSYCIIWSSADFGEMRARYSETTSNWYCETEFATIQFLRSETKGTEITTGRIAVATNHREAFFTDETAKIVDSRFRRLQRFLKKSYTNSIVRWYNSRARVPLPEPESTEPDSSLWVGPNAIRWFQWFEEDKERRIRQSGSLVVGSIHCERANKKPG